MIEIINNVSFNGKSIEEIYNLKNKLKSSLDNVSDISEVEKK